MKRPNGWFAGCTAAILAAASTAWAVELYVATNGIGDGSSWASATNSLQGAIDAIPAGIDNTVFVSNGLYAIGGRTNYPTGTVLTNRVVIWKVITVRSLNDDPTNTIIQGQWDPDTTNGPGAVRCVYMANGSRLIGFTLTNGATLALNTPVPGTNQHHMGGGTWAISGTTAISNCIYACNSAAWAGGGAYYGTLSQCRLVGNRAGMELDPANQYNQGGGGAQYANLIGCQVVSNWANEGGGVDSCSLTNCDLIGNTATRDGGGANGGSLTNCLILGNTGLTKGSGGTYYSYLDNCRVISNSAPSAAGNCGGSSGRTFRNCTFIGNWSVTAGACINGTLYNCLVMGNRSGYGGGAYASTLYNCTVVGNETVYNGGGGVYNSGPVINSIVYFNKAPGNSNWYSSAATIFSNSCTTTTGAVELAEGNTTNDPLFLVNGSGYGTNDFVPGIYTLQRLSPCVNEALPLTWMTDAGNLSSRDLAGNARVDKYSGQPDMGCYEYTPTVGTMFMVR